MSDAMQDKIAQLKRDGYRIDTEAHQGPARATWRGRVIAESDRAIVLKEFRHRPVIYFPRDGVRMDMLRRTAHTTHCPFKGDANYFSLVDGEVRAENAVWTYESPIPEVEAIKDHVAFYTQDMGATFGIVVHGKGDE